MTGEQPNVGRETCYKDAAHIWRTAWWNGQRERCVWCGAIRNKPEAPSGER